MQSADKPVTLESLAYGGDGVGHVDGRVVFVPDGVPGDRILLKIEEDKGTYLRGRIQELLSPSPDRVTPFCPLAAKCGGCQWQNIAYPTQLFWKHRIVEESLRRIGGLENITVEPCVPSIPDREYRSVVRFPARTTKDGVIWGYYERNSHNLVAIDSCPVASGRVNTLTGYFGTVFGTEPFPELREVVIQASQNHPSSLISLTAAGNYDFTPIAGKMLADIEGLAGVSIRKATGDGKTQHIRTYGDLCRYETIGSFDFRISERSFFQVNIPQTEKIVGLASEMAGAEPGIHVVDGYGGVGLFSITTGSPDSSIHLFDSSRSAVRDSRHNAGLRKTGSFTAHCEDAETAFRRICHADLMYLDPPRTGLGRKVVTAACAAGANVIVYISCNPATFARDLKHFVKNGYKIDRIVPVDMFPHTYHIETIVKMNRTDS